MKKNIKTLAKELDFSTSSEYYQYITDSFINGNRSQVKALFNAMANENKCEYCQELAQGDPTELEVLRYLISSVLFSYTK